MLVTPDEFEYFRLHPDLPSPEGVVHYVLKVGDEFADPTRLQINTDATNSWHVYPNVEALFVDWESARHRQVLPWPG